jgi:hypothetical protein
LEGLGVGYYRIESVDNDGRKNYSEIRTLNLKPQTLNSVSIYPNPCKDFVNISCVGMKEIKLINAIGQVIYQSNNINASTLKIATNNFAKGLYMLQVSSLNKTENIKLLVE